MILSGATRNQLIKSGVSAFWPAVWACVCIMLPLAANGQSANDVDVRAQKLARWNNAVEHVRFVRHRVEFPQAGATLEVPEHFKFIDLVHLRYLMQSQGRTPDPEVIGWLIHESIDLKQSGWWYLQVTWHDVGHTNARTLASISPERLLSRARNARNGSRDSGAEKVILLGYAQAPVWGSGSLSTVWSERLSFPESRETLVDCHAVKPGREGYLGFKIRYMQESREELCFRTTRLVLGGAQFKKGFGYYDYRNSKHRTARFDLSAVVAGEAR